MYTYIALFRGINVGGRNILPMRELAEILEGMGCEDIKTYIQSGNVVFRSKKKKSNKAPKEISSKILDSRGFEPKVLLFEISDFKKAIENCPFKTENGKTLHFYFLDSPPNKPDIEGLTALQSKSEEFKLNKNIFYLYAPDGIGRSKLAAKVERCLGVSATARNWNTVRKLMSMAKSNE